MRRFVVATTSAAAATTTAAAFCSNFSPVSAASSVARRMIVLGSGINNVNWDELSSDTLALYSQKAFGVGSHEDDGIIFSDILGLDESLLGPDFIPAGESCVGVILCHPVDGRISAFKQKQLVASSSASPSTRSAAVPRLFLRQGPNGGCGPCAVANVLGNMAPSSSTSDSENSRTALAQKVLAAVENEANLFNVNEAVAAAASPSFSSSFSCDSAKDSTNIKKNDATQTKKYHYTSFVPINGRIVELDSLVGTPIDWGVFCYGGDGGNSCDGTTVVDKNGKNEFFLRGTAKVLQRYFDTLPNRIDFAAVAVTANASEKGGASGEV